jgi:glycosyltransferase involved in cell wall biosynthesis
MTGPLVTVGIPFYNPGVALRAAIRSILLQSYESIELLLVNDGSTDGSLQIAHEFRDDRIRYHDDRANRGFIPRLNQIIDLAKGEYIARMDADDVSHPRRIERQVEYLNTHPRVDVVGTDMYVIDRSGRVLGVLARTGTPNELTAVNRTALNHATVMGRREWWQSNRYDTAFRRAEDKELFARAATKSTYVSIPEPLYYYDFRIRLRPFLASYLSDIKVVLRYGPGRLGLRSTAASVATYLLKAAALPLLFVCGRESVVVERNLRKLSDAEVQSANQALQSIIKSDDNTHRE